MNLNEVSVTLCFRRLKETKFVQHVGELSLSIRRSDLSGEETKRRVAEIFEWMMRKPGGTELKIIYSIIWFVWFRL